jgi:ferric-dicitrate binding protein FerR (iron transport regulator)
MNSMTTCDSVWWLLELELSEGVEQTFDSFDTWIENHPQYRAAFLRLERAWNAMDQMYVSTHVGRHPPQESIGDTPRAGPGRRISGAPLPRSRPFATAPKGAEDPRA